MTLSTLLKDYTTYNVWANTQYVNWLKGKPLDLMHQEVASSFPSIHLTLLHIWSAEKVWIERLQQVPQQTFLAQTFTGTTEELFDGILANSVVFETFIHAQSEDFFQETCHFRLLNGTEDSRPRHQMILHCMQHSTYHRGQLVTMARSLGMTDPPISDYIFYVRTTGR
jgi:uncharacterized damage-inducible protein DinB